MKILSTIQFSVYKICVSVCARARVCKRARVRVRARVHE